MNIPERMKHFNVPGVSVTHFANGELCWSKNFGTLEKGTDKAVDDNSIFHACSISKMITALCVLRLAQDGALDLHKNVNEYLVSWKVPNSRLVTLANLLAHQAGFYDCDDSFSPYKNGDCLPKTIDILRDVHVEYTPETDCEYSDTGYCVISQVLDDVLGETILQISKRLVFEPLGLKHTFFWDMHKALTDCAVGHDSNGGMAAWC